LRLSGSTGGFQGEAPGLPVDGDVDERGTPSSIPGDDGKDAGCDEAPEVVLAASSFSSIFSTASLVLVSANTASSEKRLAISTNVCLV